MNGINDISEENTENVEMTCSVGNIHTIIP